MLNGGIEAVKAGSSCTARSVGQGSSCTGEGGSGEVDVHEVFTSTGHDRGKSRCSSHRAATSSREIVTDDPEQPTASIVRSL